MKWPWPAAYMDRPRYTAPMHENKLFFRTIITCQYKICFNDFCRYNLIIIGEIKLNEVAVASCEHRSAPMHGPDA